MAEKTTAKKTKEEFVEGTTIAVGKPSFRDFDDNGRQEVSVDVVYTHKELYKGHPIVSKETKRFTTVIKKGENADAWLANLAEGN